jgi:branched-chain amino acid transport system ATP-binding protein
MGEPPPLLQVNRISKHFGGVNVIDDFSMSVAKGEIRALIGPNGAGKTTMFNMISGILAPAGGNITFEGKDITVLPPEKIAALGIGRTFQISKLFGDMTVIDNILIGMHTKFTCNFWSNAIPLPGARQDERKKQQLARGYLSIVGLEAKADVEARVLPQGDRQLLQIARAVASEPKLIMLDEPAAGLNSTEAKALISLLRGIRSSGITIIVVDHDMQFIMDISDSVTVLNRGQKIAEGTPQEITSNHDVIDAYLGTNIVKADKC